MTTLSTTLNNMMAAYPANFRMGIRHGRGINLRRPQFDCEWYWGFGYLGNIHCHYHLESLHISDYNLRYNMNMFDQLKAHFGDSLTITDDKDLWAFCEVVQTIYTLRKVADLYHRGGSHYTTNPDKELLQNLSEWERINSVLIPAQIASMYAILAKYAK